MWPLFLSLCIVVAVVTSLPMDLQHLATDYFQHKGVRLASYLSCEKQFKNKHLVKQFLANDIRVSVTLIERLPLNLDAGLRQWGMAVGVLVDGTCDGTRRVLQEASQAMLFDSTHVWAVITDTQQENDTAAYIDDQFQHLNLSIDADIVVVSYDGDRYKLADVFNFGKIQGNNLETGLGGVWRRDAGLNISLNGFKYYDRWDFHNLTLRAVSVILERPRVFTPRLLSDASFTPGVSAMTKVVAQLLDMLKQQHNFRFNYTIVDRWVGSPEKNSTLAVTNSMFWRQQDISCTCLRIYPKWLDWMDPFFPPATKLETKFYYLIPERGVGEYENRFLRPLSAGAWACACAAAAACACVLAAAARVERRPEPALYAVASVLAATCQQAYEDGVQILEGALSSQGRRGVLLVVGLTSMLLYNYYTSSVVSWLLSAAPPSIDSLQALMRSDLELVFEDIGYTRGWLDNPGFYYYSGYRNPLEDQLRERKVLGAARSAPVLLPVGAGLRLVRTGAYAYHSEPYTASQVIGRAFSERELCALGALQMMRPAPVYVVGQPRSPYRQFFVWSMMRLSERGHIAGARARVSGHVPACSGRAPRALALGQAAPAAALLALGALLAALVLVAEIMHHRYRGVAVASSPWVAASSCLHPQETP